MANVTNIIAYELGMNDDDNLCFQRYAKVRIAIGDNPEDILNSLIGKDDLSSADNPPAIIHHPHLAERQRLFSLLVEPGYNIYAIRLANVLGCQFGGGSEPVSLASPEFTGAMTLDMVVRQPNGNVLDAKRASTKDIYDYNWLTFTIDRDKILAPLAVAGDHHHDDGGHRHDGDDGQGTALAGAASVPQRHAIPFFFNLYDKKEQKPIWVLNNHGHGRAAAGLMRRAGPHPDSQAAGSRFHGGPHPNSNGYLVIE